MSIESYIWLYLSEKDIEIFDSAFWKTSNLYCHHNSYQLICPAVITENNLHSHNEVWNPENSNFSLLCETNKGSSIINVTWKKVTINNVFISYLINLVFEAHELAKKIKQEGQYGEVISGGIEATINSLANKWSYSETPVTILDIAADLMISIACRHKFSNGNKRTALITGVLFLKFCGLFLWETDKEVEDYASNWEQFMINIVEFNSNKKMSENELISWVKSTIDSSLAISYNIY